MFLMTILVVPKVKSPQMLYKLLTVLYGRIKIDTRLIDLNVIGDYIPIHVTIFRKFISKVSPFDSWIQRHKYDFIMLLSFLKKSIAIYCRQSLPTNSPAFSPTLTHRFYRLKLLPLCCILV